MSPELRRERTRLTNERNRALELARYAQAALQSAPEFQHARLNAELAALLRAAANAQDALAAVGRASVERWCQPERPSPMITESTKHRVA